MRWPFGIDRSESRVFAWSVAALFLIGWTDVSFRNAAETLFVKRVGVGFLPHVFLASSLLLVLTTWFAGRLAARFDRLKLLPLTLLVLAAMLVVCAPVLAGEMESVLIVLLVASRQLGSVSMLVFWLAMGDLVHSRQAKRLYGPLTAGATLGTILGSFVSGPVGLKLGLPGLVAVSAGTMALAAVVTLPLRALRPVLELDAKVAGASREAPERRSSKGAGGFGGLWRSSRLFRLLVVTTLANGTLAPMLYFQFQFVADQATSGAGGEQLLLTFYSQFRGWIAGGILIAQLSTGWLYRRIGLPLAVALSPLIYLLGFSGLSVQMSLFAGVAAMSAVKLQDNAIYDPAVRVFYTLFPERLRPRAAALLEGPCKRIGGSLGNVISLVAVTLGSIRWVGYAALPIAGLWLGIALWLRRTYPRLLLAASTLRAGAERPAEVGTLLDAPTVRSLIGELQEPDPERARIVIDLVQEAHPTVAVPALVDAATRAPATIRNRLLAGLCRILERADADAPDDPHSARTVANLLAQATNLGTDERIDLVRAYGRLAPRRAATTALDAAIGDPSPAVRLAARAALERRAAATGGGGALDAALKDALAGDDPDVQRTARRELRSLLLDGPPEGAWHDRLLLLVEAYERTPGDDEAIEIIADVAARHGVPAAGIRDRLLAARETERPRRRAALLRYCGHAGLIDQAPWLVEHLDAGEPACRVAAADGLRALGAPAARALLRELTYGRRSRRASILAAFRSIDVAPPELRELYERELDAVSRDMALASAITGRPDLDLLMQRLEERVRERLHVCLLFLAAMRHEDLITQLGEQLQRAARDARRYAVVLEALDAAIRGEDAGRIVPLLESAHHAAWTQERGKKASIEAPTAIRDLRADPEDLTQTIAVGLTLASRVQMGQHVSVDTVHKMLHLKAIPLFAELTTRQLMRLAEAAELQSHEDASVVVRQGDYDDRLYVLLDGGVDVARDGTALARLGPGDFFGEIALFEGVARSATVTTHGPTQLLGLDRADLLRMIEEMPGIAVDLLRVLSRRVREATDRLIV